MKYTDTSGVPLVSLLGFKNLSGEDLSELNLKQAKLKNENLEGVKFQGTELSGADLSGAKLTGCDFSGALLSGAMFRDSYGYKADFSGAKLDDAEFRHGELRNCIFDDSDLQGAVFAHVNLDNSSFQRACAIRTDFVGCYMLNVVFYDLEVAHTRFMWNVDLDFETFSNGTTSIRVLQFLRSKGCTLELKGDEEWWTNQFGRRP